MHWVRFADSQTLEQIHGSGLIARIFWDLETGERLAGNPHDPSANRVLDISADRSATLEYDRDRQLYIRSADGSLEAYPIAEVSTVFDARFLPDGTIAIAYSNANPPEAFGIDVATRQIVWRKSAPSGAMWLRPDLERIVIDSGWDEQPDTYFAHVLDARTGQLIKKVPRENSGFSSSAPIDFSGRYLMRPGPNGTMFVLDPYGEVSATLLPIDPAASSVRFFDGSGMIASMDDETGEARLHSLEDGSEVANLTELGLPSQNPGELNRIAVNTAGTRIYLETNDGLKVWDVGAETFVESFQAKGLPVHAIDVSPDGSRLALYTGGAPLYLLDAMTGATVASNSDNEREVIARILFSGDGSRIVEVANNGQLTIHPIGEGGNSISLGRGVASFVWFAESSNSYFALYGDSDIEKRAADTFEITQRRVNAGRNGEALDAAEASGYLLAASSQALFLIDPESGDELWRRTRDSGNQPFGSVSSDGNRFAISDSAAASIEIIDLGESEPARIVPLPEGSILEGTTLSPDGAWLAFSVRIVEDGEWTTYATMLASLESETLDNTTITESVTVSQTAHSTYEFSPDSATLYVQDGSQIKAYEVENATMMRSYNLPAGGSIFQISASSGPEGLFLRSEAGEASFLDTDSGDIAGPHPIVWKPTSGGSGVATDLPHFAAAADGRSYWFIGPDAMLTAWRGLLGRPASVQLVQTDGFAARFDTSMDRLYELETSHDLIQWDSYKTLEAEGDGAVEEALPTSLLENRIFLRVWELLD